MTGTVQATELRPVGGRGECREEAQKCAKKSEQEWFHERTKGITSRWETKFFREGRGPSDHFFIARVAKPARIRAMSPRWRPIVFAGVALVAIWIVAVVGYTIAKNAKATPEKVKAYVESIDLSKLSAEERAKAIRKLADMLNKLSLEDRRRARLERLTWGWFNEMTEDEKGAFLEATMPTGFKQMLTSFEQLPEDKRKKTVDDALRRLKEAQTQDPSLANNNGTNGPPVLSKELEAKVRSIGLQTFYSQSSAQTKAELAPVLEELQKIMESGRPFRR